jgi:hypothetical protein
MPVSGFARKVRFETKRFRPLGAFWNQEEGAFYGQERVDRALLLRVSERENQFNVRPPFEPSKVLAF